MKRWWIPILLVCALASAHAFSKETSHRPSHGSSSAHADESRASDATSTATLEAILRRHGVERSHPRAHQGGAPIALHSGGAGEIWSDLLAGNERFVAGMPRDKDFPQVRRRLVSGQKPPAIVLGCADSRVSPELAFDQGLGDLFVVRTAGNIADPIALGSIEYAAEHLHSKVLLVLGHENCGAVGAAASGEQMPSAGLQAIVDRIQPVFLTLPAHLTGADRIHAAVHANVQESADTLLRQSRLLRARVASGELTLIKAVYDLESGSVSKLD